MLCRYTAVAVAIYRAKSVSARNEAIPSGSDGVTEQLSVHVEFPFRERSLFSSSAPPYTLDSPIHHYHHHHLHRHHHRLAIGRVGLSSWELARATRPNRTEVRGGPLYYGLLCSVLQCARFNNVILSGWPFQS